MSTIADANITNFHTLVADPKSWEEPARVLQVGKDIVGSALEEAGFGAFNPTGILSAVSLNPILGNPCSPHPRSSVLTHYQYYILIRS